MAKLTMDDVDEGSERLSQQVISFFLHTLIALGVWLAMMLVGNVFQPSVSQMVILAFSILVPMIVGYLVTKMKPDEMAAQVWLAGLILLLIICLWVLDMPTGPNACLDCSATEKLTRTLFSIPSPSGLIDNNGPFFATWPAAALLGYSIGAKLVLRRRQSESAD